MDPLVQPMLGFVKNGSRKVSCQGLNHFPTAEHYENMKRVLQGRDLPGVDVLKSIKIRREFMLGQDGTIFGKLTQKPVLSQKAAVQVYT